MAERNQAAWLDGKGQKLRVGDAAMPKPEADEIVVQNRAIAVNPVEWKIQDWGFMVQQWPTCLGMDVAGEIYDVGANVKRFRKGDRVIARLVGMLDPNPRQGAYQLLSVAPAVTTAKLPDSVSFTDGVVLPVAFDTALVGLFSPTGGGLGLPTLSVHDTKQTTDKTIVVWGGSSSVGALATQLATAAGVAVIAVASSRNFDFCKKCGGSEVFDYREQGIVDAVVEAVKRTGTFAGILDCISLPGQSYEHCVAIIQKLGGGPLAAVLPEGPEAAEGVAVSHVWGMGPITHPYWSDYITPALESGTLQCLPPPLIIGEGLDSLQKGVDRSRKGVSAQKIVVKL